MPDDNTQQPTVFDTDQQQLGAVYAKALLGFGQQSGKLDELMEELSGVTDAVNKLPKLKAALESPRIDVASKHGLIEKAFSGRISKEMLNFLKIVSSKSRLDCLGAIQTSAEAMHDEMAGRVQATLTTAEPIEDSLRDQVASKLSKSLGKKVSLKSTVDPSIIGGMVVRVGDTVYDSSVVSQLEQVRVKAAKRAADAIREKLDRFAIAD